MRNVVSSLDPGLESRFPDRQIPRSLGKAISRYFSGILRIAVNAVLLDWSTPLDRIVQLSDAGKVG